MKFLSFVRNVVRFGALALALAAPLIAQRNVTLSVAGNELTAAGSATVVLSGLGVENALGFTVTFDPTVLRYDSVANGADVAGATVHVNASQSGGGRLGLAIALPSGSAFAPGDRALVVLHFTVLAAARTSTTLGFADTPITREVSDSQAQVLPATYSGTTVSAGPATRN